MSAVTTLGRYRIIREIARSNDIVYEALDPQTGRRVALKQLLLAGNLAGQARRERIERFQREARAAARLRHPNIVHIHNHGQAGEHFYIAMEFLQGQPLRDLLQARGALPLSEALRIAGAVADGLAYAHSQGVVHRDVKPDNVHVEPDGRVVLTDFGIARLVFEPSLTADGQVFGTPSYMSPEQVAGRPIDARSDLFSLGVMLYEMVSGRKPFTGDTVVTVTYGILNADPPPLTGPAAALEPVLRRLLAKEPAQRYPGAAQVAEDLRALREGRPPPHARALPLPARQWGAGARASPGGLPPPRPAPAPAAAPPLPPRGARPLPAPLPPRLAAPGPAAALAGTPLLPGPPPAPTPAQPAPSTAANAWWLLGWLAVAVVIAGMILAVVWASVTAFDRFQADHSMARVERTRTDADRAFAEKRFAEALNGYLRVAERASGPDREIARRNAAMAAAELAQESLETKPAAEAERLARQALQLHPDFAWGHVVLGRALAALGRLDEAVTAFDAAVTAAEKRAAAGAPEPELRASREAAASAPLWKAQALLQEGEALMTHDPPRARARLEAAIAAAPHSDFARNARAHLLRLDSGGVLPAPGTQLDPSQPAPPPGWDDSYRNVGPP